MVVQTCAGVTPELRWDTADTQPAPRLDWFHGVMDPSTDPSESPSRPLSPSPSRRLSRRAALGTGGAAALTLLVAVCSSGSDDTAAPSTTTGGDRAAGSGDGGSGDGGVGGSDAGELSSGTPSSTVFTATDFAALGACLLSPEQTEGPYPTITQIERRDIRESLVGHPLRLGVQVVDETCAPVPGAVVEIWHCDTDGDYSSYLDGGTDDDAGDGTTFLRGSQRTNDDGIVEFVTNYPGWYRGRAVHIHTKVHLDDTTVLTSQIFFDDELNSEIFRSAPYRGDPDTTNLEDSIAGGDPAENGSQATASTDDALRGTRALLVLGIDPDAESTAGGPGGGPTGGPTGGPGGGPGGGRGGAPGGGPGGRPGGPPPA